MPRPTPGGMDPCRTAADRRGQERFPGPAANSPVRGQVGPVRNAHATSPGTRTGTIGRCLRTVRRYPPTSAAIPYTRGPATPGTRAAGGRSASSTSRSATSPASTGWNWNPAGTGTTGRRVIRRLAAGGTTNLWRAGSAGDQVVEAAKLVSACMASSSSGPSLIRWAPPIRRSPPRRRDDAPPHASISTIPREQRRPSGG